MGEGGGIIAFYRDLSPRSRHRALVNRAAQPQPPAHPASHNWRSGSSSCLLSALSTAGSGHVSSGREFLRRSTAIS